MFVKHVALMYIVLVYIFEFFTCIHKHSTEKLYCYNFVCGYVLENELNKRFYTLKKKQNIRTGTVFQYLV